MLSVCPRGGITSRFGCGKCRAFSSWRLVSFAATTNAILRRVADRADISLEWDIRFWRLNMLRCTPTAEVAMSDAADAHLIVFAIRHFQTLPVWLRIWLERWAALRHIPDA